LFNGERSKILPANLNRIAYRKLRYLHNAENLNDLRVSPGNHLEKLTKDRKGQYSIRINEKYRICFTWKNGNAYGVEVTNYH
jgi:proteic killer suppression protein